jgi:glycosyltransferase involved in cell wall biosynthesis
MHNVPSLSSPLAAALPTAWPPPTAEQSAAIDMIRVLHVINGEYYAGAERVQDLLAKNLPACGFSVGFACVKPDLFDEMREYRAAPLYATPMVNRFDLRAAARVARIVREGGYRLLHGHTVRTALVGRIAAAMTGVPLVYHAHSPASHDSTRRWMNCLNGWIERQSLRHVSRVIAVSQAMAAHIAREGFEAARIRVVPNGVPLAAAARHRDQPSGRWTLGAVALFRPRKGIEVLLEAMAKLRRLGVNVHLRAVGPFASPQYAAEIARHVERLGLTHDVSWVGLTRHVTDELLKMDLFILPSLFGEGLPMVVLEAMTAGVPIVATRVAGVPEAIRHAQDGVLVNPADADDLARAIADVIAGRYDWSALRASAMARHADCFSDRAMAAGVAAVYRELL